MNKLFNSNNDENIFYNNISQNRKRTAEIDHEVTVKLSVDFVRFSISYRQLDDNKFLNLFNAIRRLSTEKPEFHFINGKYYFKSKKYTIRIKNNTYVIIATLPYYDSMPILLTVNDADLQVVRYLEPYLSQLRYHISWIEYTIDFFSNNAKRVYQFMLSHLLLKWPGKKSVSKTYETTFYRNDLRGSGTKGLRCYHKKILDSFGREIVSIRVELLAKRQLLKKYNIQSISDFISSNSDIVIKYIAFKKFNYSIFIKRLRELGYDQIGVSQEINRFKKNINNGFLQEANQAAKKMRIRNESDTYLVKHEFHDYFLSKLRGLSFINGDSFSFSLDKLRCLEA